MCWCFGKYDAAKYNLRVLGQIKDLSLLKNIYSSNYVTETQHSIILQGHLVCFIREWKVLEKGWGEYYISLKGNS